MDEAASALDITTEILLLTITETFIYKVPPLKSASGHRAEEWGLDKPLFTGLLRVFQHDQKLRIVLYSYNNPASLSTDTENLSIFGECPIEVKPKEDILAFVDSVIDSSRYFVLRSTQTFTAYPLKTNCSKYINRTFLG
jgi:hypothetical protein